jgi:hypothetical protein
VTDTLPPLAATPPAPVCRNCGAVTEGAYCANCGQETGLALPTVRALLREAAGRYVALDGRLWRTMSAPLFRPGFLTVEYFAGRRRRYIRPARLFLVLSIALFALLRRRAAAFNALPQQQKAEQISAGVLRYGPYAVVALLPVFALLTKLVYMGRAKPYPARPRRYAAHLVFGAHSHAFLFLAGSLIVLLPVPLVRGALGVWAIFYLLWSMKTVYGGRWSGVLARAFVICVAYSVFFPVAVGCLLVAAILLR